MQVRQLPFSDTSIQRPLTLDYLQEKAELSENYQFAPNIAGSLAAIKARQQKPVDRQALSEQLLADYRRIIPGFDKGNSPVKHQIEKLKDEHTFTVTTGHQLNIFGGPLYYFYKMFSCVRACQALKEAYPDYHFVPVYWMATEDHDFEEINSFFAFGKTFEWSPENPQGAVGALPPEELKTVLNDLEDSIREKSHFEDLKNVFEAAFSQGSLADAVLYWVHQMMEQYGLVVLDANRKVFKKAFQQVVKKDILSQNLAPKVVQASEALSDYKLPVNPRKINHFYMEDGLRERIVFQEKSGDFEVLNTHLRFSVAEMEKLIEEQPEKLSPNVVTRPMYQESILPNIAYIGGTNEIAYWLQLKAAFEEAEVFFPQLLVRSSALVVGKGLLKKMKKFDLAYPQLFQDFDKVVKNYLKTKESTEPIHEELKVLQKSYSAILKNCGQFQGDLRWEIVNSIKDQQKALGKTRKNLEKALKERNEKDIQQIEKIFEKIHPEGVFQERKENFIPYYLIYGEAFFDILAENLNPFEQQLSILEG